MTKYIKNSLLFLFLMLSIQGLPSVSAPIEWECTEAEPYRTTSLLKDRKEETTTGLAYGISDQLGVSQGGKALNPSFQDTVPPLASLQQTTINQTTNSFAETNQALQNQNLSWWERMALMRQGNAELEAIGHTQTMSTKVWEVGIDGAGFVAGSAGTVSKLAKGTKIVKTGQWGKGLRQGTRLAPISEEISVFTKQKPTHSSRNLEGLDLKIVPTQHGQIKKIEKAPSVTSGKVRYTTTTTSNSSQIPPSSTSVAANRQWTTSTSTTSSSATSVLSNIESPHTPQLPANNYKLRYALANEQQMKEAGTIIAGRGAKKAFDDAPRIVAQYGGKPEDWVKKKSSIYQPTDGNPFRTHWIENLQTSERIEFKIKLKEKQ